MRKVAIVFIILGIIFGGVTTGINPVYAQNTLEEKLREKPTAWYDITEVDYFFADNIYGVMAGLLNQTFVGIYTAFIKDFKIMANALFGLGLTVYVIMGLKGNLDKTVKELIRTVIIATITFEMTINMDIYQDWIYDMFFMFPNTVQDFFFSIPMPGLANSGELNTDNVFKAIISRLWKMTQAGWSFYKISGWVLAIFNCFTIAAMYLYYLAYWIIQFNFLLSLFMYMVVGLPILFLLSFSFTKHIFTEWIRGMFTVALYPVFSTLIIYIVNNFLFFVALDLEKNVITDDVVATPVLAALVVIAIGFTFLRNVPQFAASLTRGTGTSGMDAGKPIDFAKGAVSAMAGAAFKDKMDKSASERMISGVGNIANSARKGVGKLAGKASGAITSGSDSIRGGAKGGNDPTKENNPNQKMGNGRDGEKGSGTGAQGVQGAKKNGDVGQQLRNLEGGDGGSSNNSSQDNRNSSQNSKNEQKGGDSKNNISQTANKGGDTNSQNMKQGDQKNRSESSSQNSQSVRENRYGSEKTQDVSKPSYKPQKDMGRRQTQQTDKGKKDDKKKPDFKVNKN